MFLGGMRQKSSRSVRDAYRGLAQDLLVDCEWWCFGLTGACSPIAGVAARAPRRYRMLKESKGTSRATDSFSVPAANSCRECCGPL